MLDVGDNKADRADIWPPTMEIWPQWKLNPLKKIIDAQREGWQLIKDPFHLLRLHLRPFNWLEYIQNLQKILINHLIWMFQRNLKYHPKKTFTELGTDFGR